jgi:hypothetical protein
MFPFNRLSIAYLPLNLLEADCSARERYLRYFARMEKRRGSDGHSGSEFALATLIRVNESSYRWPGARMLIGRTEGESARLTRESIQTLECANMAALLKQ